MSASSDEAIKAVAARLFDARQSARAISPVRDDLPAMDIAAAYAVQQINVKRMVEAGARKVGRKIGLTSAVVQKQLGVDQPDFGVLFDAMAHHGDDVDLTLAGLIAPRIEAEIAFVLGADIPERGLDRQALAGRIASVAAAAEIVDSAIENWRINIVDTIADNASSGAFVLGVPQPFVAGMDLTARAMRLLKDGEERSAGVGAASLGDPINALSWLADTAAGLGEPLLAGDIILAGALGPMVDLTPGLWRIEIDGFAPLTVRAAQ